jgi:prefoldin beta subunit
MVISMNQDQAKMVSEFQTYQQQLQSIMIQKESLKMQDLEIDKAIEELTNSKEEKAYKITGNIMVSKPVEDIKKELNETKETIDLRVKSLEKTEERINNKLKDLQEQLKEVLK